MLTEDDNTCWFTKSKGFNFRSFKKNKDLDQIKKKIVLKVKWWVRGKDFER